MIHEHEQRAQSSDWIWGIFAGLVLIGLMAAAEGRWSEICDLRSEIRLSAENDR